MKVQRTIQVSESAAVLSDALKTIVAACQKALADGWQPATDVPSIVLTATGELGKVIKEIPDIPADLAEDKIAFVRGLLNGALDVGDLFI